MSWGGYVSHARPKSEDSLCPSPKRVSKRWVSFDQFPSIPEKNELDQTDLFLGQIRAASATCIQSIAQVRVELMRST